MSEELILMASAEEGSQYGSQLTLYAPGVQIAVQAVTGFQPVLRTGTSVGTLH
jgi:hypothetical protein